MMNADQVRSLVGRGMDVGAHTVSHPILTRLAPSRGQGRDPGQQGAPGEIIDRPVTLFAYPNGVPRGDYAAEHVQMVREAGFDAAVSTAWGAAFGESGSSTSCRASRRGTGHASATERDSRGTCVRTTPST